MAVDRRVCQEIVKFMSLFMQRRGHLPIRHAAQKQRGASPMIGLRLETAIQLEINARSTWRCAP